MFCSYAMGMGDEILSLESEGFRLERDGENYTVLFPRRLAGRWELFVREHLQAGYWNEYLAKDRTVFLFHLEEGFRRYEVFGYQNEEVHALCEKLSECSLPSIKEMLWGNWFYRLQMIRDSERRSHEEVYRKETLYQGNSWLKKPVQTVVELLGQFEGCSHFRGLDLGCGVGRNAIAVAQAVPGKIDCVDLLETAVEGLVRNGRAYGVEDRLRGIVCAIEDFPIEEKAYDLIMAVSALEHLASKEAFEGKLREIAAGLKDGGIFCLIANTQVTEQDAGTGEPLVPQFEVNLPTEELCEMMENVFAAFSIQKHTVVSQEYNIPRDMGISHLQANVVTYVVRKKKGLTK